MGRTRAGLFRVINRTYGNVPDAYKSQIDDLFNQVETVVNTSLPDADQSTYLKGTANSTVFATKGLGVDYASSPSLFIVGYGIGLGMDLGKNSFSDFVGGKVDANQIRGFGAQASVMGGLNLGGLNAGSFGPLDLKRVTIFLNFMAMDLPKIDDGFSGSVSSFGFHVQYRLMEERGVAMGLLRWGGLSFTTGIDRASMKVNFAKDFNQSEDITLDTLPGDPTVTANFNGQANVGADVNVTTIPFELSTYGRFLYLFTGFFGLAADLNFGEASSKASLTGPVTVTDSSNTLGNISAEANLDLGDKGSPTSLNGRWFAGMQLNLTLLKAYLQLNHGIGEDTWGVTGGLRIAY